VADGKVGGGVTQRVAIRVEDLERLLDSGVLEVLTEDGIELLLGVTGGKSCCWSMLKANFGNVTVSSLRWVRIDPV
jgi:hypothetical protein